MYFYIRAVVRNSAVTAVYKIIFRGIFRFSSLENVSYEEKIGNGLGSVWRALPKVKRQVRRSQKTARGSRLGLFISAASRMPGFLVCRKRHYVIMFVYCENFHSYISYIFPILIMNFRKTPTKSLSIREHVILKRYTFFSPEIN